MADTISKTLKTRISLKYDTWANWSNVSTEGQGGRLVLKKGEVGFCAIEAANVNDSSQLSNGNVITNAPTVLFKVGDGTNEFQNLKWASATAADVYSWAKQSGLTIKDEETGTFITDIEWLNDAIVVHRGDVTIPEYTAGDKIDITNYVVSHEKLTTPAAGVEDSTAKTFISGVTVDDFGHITGYTYNSIDEVIEDTNTTYTLSAENNEIILTPNKGDPTKVILTAGNNITVATGDKDNTITISGKDWTDDIDNAIDEKLKAFQGAFNYVGVSSTDPSTGTVTVEEINNFVSGDIVLYEDKEYVYNGTTWESFGSAGDLASSSQVAAAIDTAQDYTDAAIDKLTNGTTPVKNATEAEHATNADKATEADHATNADNATKATDADHATNADHSLTADALTEEGKNAIISPLAGDATIASISNDNIITLKAGIVQTNGVIDNNDGDDIPLAKIAATGNIADLVQTEGTYIFFDCGSSTEVI